jgi:tetratricopeptide (TPR) repeat protein
MKAIELLMAGRFGEAIVSYQDKLKANQNDEVAISGLASAYMGLGNYQDAIHLKYKVHEMDKAEVPDSPGQHLSLVLIGV